MGGVKEGCISLIKSKDWMHLIIVPFALHNSAINTQNCQTNEKRLELSTSAFLSTRE